MSVNLKGNVKKRLKTIIEILNLYDIDTPFYTFINFTSNKGYALMHNDDSLICNEDHIYYTKEQLETYLKEQANNLNVKKITPILVNVVDNNQLEQFFK